MVLLVKMVELQVVKEDKLLLYQVIKILKKQSNQMMHKIVIVEGTIKTTDGDGYGLKIKGNKTIMGKDRKATIYGGLSISGVKMLFYITLISRAHIQTLDLEIALISVVGLLMFGFIMSLFGMQMMEILILREKLVILLFHISNSITQIKTIPIDLMALLEVEQLTILKILDILKSLTITVGSVI